MTKQKKPKTGDVVRWAVVDCVNDMYDQTDSREDARHSAKLANEVGRFKPYRIAKIVLAK